MNEKITTQRLVELLVEKAGIGRNNAESFLKTMFGLIEEALQEDKYVKIKGIGTFKIIEVESRESVDVNTNERILIEGHPKITFVPEPALRDLINKPFAHFETVILNDNVSFNEETFERDDEDETDEAIDDTEPADDTADEAPETVAENTAEEPPVAEDNNATSDEAVEEKAVEKEVPPVIVPEQPVEEVKEEVQQQQPQDKKEEISEEQPKEEPLKEESHSEKENIKVSPTPIKVVKEETMTPQSIAPSEVSQDEVQQSNPETVNSYSLHFAITLTLLLLALGGGTIIYFCYPQLLSKKQSQLVVGDSILNKKEALKTNVQKHTLSLQDSITLLRNLLADAERREQLASGSDSASQVSTPKKEIVEDENTASKTKEVATKKAEPKKAKKPEKVEKDKDDKSTEKKKTRTINGHKISGTLQVVTLQPGQTLISLSRQFYGTKDLWIVIAEYNKPKIKDADHVPIGTKIKVPKIEK
jgi:nucleoid DNA-binding protein